MFDADRNNSLTFLEFMLVYSILTWGEAEKIVEKLFDVFDVDGTGRVSKDEMKSVVRDLHVLLKHLYNSYSQYHFNPLFL